MGREAAVPVPEMETLLSVALFLMEIEADRDPTTEG